jgi:hypothetical protein
MTLEFILDKSDDPSIEDDQYCLYENGIDTNVSIQVCLIGGGYVVGCWDDKESTQTYHGDFRTKAQAEKCAAQVWKNMQ